ncbi:phosphoglycolate phosphatase [mine drainage metagenome]|uniref:Phosphoglycolate phosphatase n=1 Tax=mine drainage metagenome TaxID=410659 RepID=A0A1J5S1I8_9ZZZZ
MNVSCIVPMTGSPGAHLWNPPVMDTAPTHLLLDFFGTVVDYSASRTVQGYATTYRVLRRMGSVRGYDDTVAAWSTSFEHLDALTSHSNEEFSMRDVARAALAVILDREPAQAEVDAGAEAYLADWNRSVVYPDDMLAILTDLRGLGAAGLVDVVVTSVDVGWRKPHPAIYAAALNALGVDARDAVFVGDSYLAEYVGPERTEIRAFLIDPDRVAPVPEPRRIDTLADLAGRLRGLG